MNAKRDKGRIRNWKPDRLPDLAGRNYLITGGNSGIGLAMADGLAAAGADVAIWGRNTDRTADAAEHLRRHETRIAGLTCDVSDEDAVGETFSATLDALGRIDACFANAGVAGIAPSSAEMDTDEWRRVISANLDGSFFTLRAAAAHLVERGAGGSLVATSSRRAAVGQPRAPHYSASKGGVVGMTLPIARDLVAVGVRVNTIAPGLIDTPIYGTGEGSEKFKAHLGQSVLFPKRLGHAAELASMVAELFRNDYMNGEVIRVDGGIRMPPK